MSLISSLPLHLLAKGLPALRAAMHGARLGVGRAGLTDALQRMGIAVLPRAASSGPTAIVAGTAVPAMTLAAAGHVVRAGADAVVLHARDGVSLGVGASGRTIASASTEMVGALGRLAPRGAFAAIGRSTLGGAAAGAVLEAVVASIGIVRSVRRGERSRMDGVRAIGMHAVRGAVSGGVGVASAGVVAAGVAAAGISAAGAPVALPLVTMILAGGAAARWFDRRRKLPPAAAGVDLPRNETVAKQQGVRRIGLR